MDRVGFATISAGLRPRVQITVSESCDAWLQYCPLASGWSVSNPAVALQASQTVCVLNVLVVLTESKVQSDQNELPKPRCSWTPSAAESVVSCAALVVRTGWMAVTGPRLIVPAARCAVICTSGFSIW